MSPLLRNSTDMSVIGNTNGFKKGFDANRYANKNTGLTVYTEKVGLMLRQQVPAEEISKYMYSVMTDPNTSQELVVKVAINIMDRACGKALPADRHYALERQKEADRSFSDLSDHELEARIVLLIAEQDKRKRVEIIINEYVKQSE